MSIGSRKKTLNLFMQQIWNAGDFSGLSELVTPGYYVSEDAYDPWSGQVKVTLRSGIV